MAVWVGYTVLCLGICFVIISIGIYFPNSKVTYAYEVIFNEQFTSKATEDPFVITGKNVSNMLFLIGIFLILLGYVLILILADVNVLSLFRFRTDLAFIAMIPLICGFLFLIFFLNKYVKKIFIYEDRIIFKSLINSKTILFGDLDLLELIYENEDTYIFSSYIFRKGHIIALKLKSKDFKNLKSIEEILA